MGLLGQELGEGDQLEWLDDLTLLRGSCWGVANDLLNGDVHLLVRLVGLAV